MENPEPRYTLMFFPVFIVGAAAVLSRSPSLAPVHQQSFQLR
jgi:hypothetical protein